MRPVLLEMEAFGPYATLATVDFEPLADVGLFVVSGPTGAGKSTIFDGICFALYGSLSGARHGHVDVRSHYADPSAECRVRFSFDAHGERWRVSRQPAQIRQKRRGAGTTERPADAVLERWTGSGWEPDAAKVRDVTARCRELVGLSLEQFERVVLLPQGKFADVLNARTADRAELLRTLFGSEVFERVGEILAEEARVGERALEGAAQQRARFHQRAIESLDRADDELDGLPAAMKARLAGAEAQRRADRSPEAVLSIPDGGGPGDQLSLLELDGGLADEADPTSGDAPATDDPLERLDRLRASVMVDLDSVASEARAAAEVARSHLDRAESQKAAIEQRRSAAAELSTLEESADEIRNLEVRLAAARRAEGLVEEIAERDRLRIEVEQSRDAIVSIWERVGRQAEDDRIIAAFEFGADAVPTAATLRAVLEHVTARTAGVDALIAKEAQLEQQRHEHASLSSRLLSLDERLGELDAMKRALSTERASLEAESEQLRPLLADRPALVLRRDEAAAKVAARRSADDLAERLTSLDQQLATHAEAAEAARSAIETASVEMAALDAQIEKRSERTAAVDAAQRRLERRVAIAEANDRLVELVVEAADKQRRADDVFASFVQNTAPRLAADLVDGDPCPVCGACEHPAPAHVANQGPDDPVDAAEVEAASAAAAAAQVERSECQAALAGLVADDPGLAEIGLDELERHRATAVASLEAIGDAEAARAQLADRASQLEGRLATVAEESARLESDRANTATGLADALGRLGEERERSRTELQSVVVELEATLERVEHATQQVEVITNRLGDIAAAVAAADVEQTQIGIDRATAAERLEQVTAAIARAVERRGDAVADSDLDTVRARLGQIRNDVVDLQDRAVDLATLEAALASATQRCRSIVDDGEFDSEAGALAASMSPAEIDAGQVQRDTWISRRASLVALLAALDAQGLPDQQPDVEALRAAAIDTDAVLRSATTALASVGQHLQQAATDLDEVASIDAATAEQRAHHEVVRRVASVVRGNNSRRLSLENWVLSVYLHDVVDHANLHLHTMSNGRYRLLVRDVPSNQVGQHGLDLVVDDAHTGRIRPSVSLSGGETFQASLALALGLADVVMVGRAGLRLDALFVDEGFGSLDADAIDQAITVLDGLRSRGSMVGVITHVEALKSALPVAIDVRPRRDQRGSEIQQVA